MKPTPLSVLALAFLACSATQANAEKFPLSLTELKKAELIVVGTVTEIRIESERSRIEDAIGNYDWGIYVSLAVDSVEKGQFTDPEVEFRCFRIKHRRSAGEYISPSGHRPIPAKGTRVRAYLYSGDSQWFAALPNGITASDANDDESVKRSHLADAPEVAELHSRRYTYVLPLEIWVLVVALALLIVVIVALARWIIRRRNIGAGHTR